MGTVDETVAQDAAHASGDEPANAGIRLDGDHSVQIGLFDALTHSLDAKADFVEIESTLQLLIDYTEIHFASEQMLMRHHNFSEFADHELQHQQLFAGFERGKACLNPNLTVPTEFTEVMDELRMQVLDHIDTWDLRFAAFMMSLQSGR